MLYISVSSLLLSFVFCSVLFLKGTTTEVQILCTLNLLGYNLRVYAFNCLFTRLCVRLLRFALLVSSSPLLYSLCYRPQRSAWLWPNFRLRNRRFFSWGLFSGPELGWLQRGECLEFLPSVRCRVRRARIGGLKLWDEWVSMSEKIKGPKIVRRSDLFSSRQWRHL